MPELLAPSLPGADTTRREPAFAEVSSSVADVSEAIAHITDADAINARREADSLPVSLEVAVLIVCHNGLEYLTDCLNSVLGSDDGPLNVRCVVVDNASSDGSAEWVAGRFPGVELIRRRENLGFAGGNNVGWEHIHRRYPNVQYIALLNQDTVVRSGWLAALVAHLEKRPTVACAQSKVMLHPRVDCLNTAGNVSHFLGFGFTTACGERDCGQFQQHRSLGLASGAAMIVRADAIERAGLFDDVFFAYLEDADLSWKLRQLGYDLAYVPRSVVFHKYNFKRDWRHYFLLERNRWLLLGTYYKTATLLLLLPALAAMEAGQLYFAWRAGVWKEKLRAYGYFMRRSNLLLLARRRQAAQRRRRVSDRRFTEPFVSRVEFTELTSPLLRRLANPCLAAYWAIARRLIYW
jgi:GT2 family glycosyltransferase